MRRAIRLSDADLRHSSPSDSRRQDEEAHVRGLKLIIDPPHPLEMISLIDPVGELNALSDDE